MVQMYLQPVYIEIAFYSCNPFVTYSELTILSADAVAAYQYVSMNAEVKVTWCNFPTKRQLVSTYILVILVICVYVASLVIAIPPTAQVVWYPRGLVALKRY